MRFAPHLFFLIVVVSACSSSSSSGRVDPPSSDTPGEPPAAEVCRTGPSCAKEPWDDQKQADCVTNRNDSVCGTEYKDLDDCSRATATCGADGYVDKVALAKSCGNESHAYSCCQSKQQGGTDKTCP